MLLLKNIRFILLAFGCSSVLFATVMAYCWNDIMDLVLRKALTLVPGSMTHTMWRETPIPLYFKVYFWNWTNPETYGQEDYVPEFAEMGPYTFIEKHTKVNVTWNANGTVTFRRIKHWWFVPELSNGSLADNVTSINVVSTTIKDLTRDWYKWLRYPLSVALLLVRQELHWTNNVGELLFEGAENVILRYGRPISTLTSRFDIPYEKFGFLIQQNDTVSVDVFNMETGENGLSQIGRLNSWNYQTRTKHYNGSCGDIVGSYGEMMPPNLGKTDVVQIFTPEVCRPLNYYYEREVQHGDMTFLKYSPNEKTFDNGTLDSDNRCFCEDEACLPTGVFSRRSCTFGAPVFMSFPHFLQADPYYRKNIKGMKPNVEKHNSEVILDPKTGAQVNVTARYQINVLLEKNLAKRNPAIFFPVMWCELHAEMSDDMFHKLVLFHQLPNVGRYFLSFVLIFGALVIFITLYYWSMLKAIKTPSLGKGQNYNAKLMEEIMNKKPKLDC